MRHILSQCGTDVQIPSLHTAVASKFFSLYPSSHCILILSPFGYQASGCKTCACGISGRKQAFASEDKEKWTIIWYKKRKQRPAWADFPDDDSESWTNKQTNKQCTKALLMSELGNCRKTQMTCYWWFHSHWVLQSLCSVSGIAFLRRQNDFHFCTLQAYNITIYEGVSWIINKKRTRHFGNSFTVVCFVFFSFCRYLSIPKRLL